MAAHKISDVEVGCFLSSGVDSSYVSTYFAGQKTFTVGFDYGERYNEIDFAKDLSEKIGLEHHYKVISPEEYWGNIRKVQYHMDQPAGGRLVHRALFRVENRERVCEGRALRRRGG